MKTEAEKPSAIINMRAGILPWLILLVLGVAVGLGELRIVYNYQVENGISDESTTGGPCLAVGTIFLLWLSGAIGARRKWLALAMFAVSIFFFVLAYIYLVQW